MNLQVIKSIQGRIEYVLLPIAIYHDLYEVIDKKLKTPVGQSAYVPFRPEDYINNPVALTRLKANLTQTDLAKRLHVSQVYISKIEKQEKVTPKLLAKIKLALTKKRQG